MEKFCALSENGRFANGADRISPWGGVRGPLWISSSTGSPHWPYPESLYLHSSHACPIPWGITSKIAIRNTYGEIASNVCRMTNGLGGAYPLEYWRGECLYESDDKERIWPLVSSR